MARYVIADEVWRQLDHNTGRMTRRGAWRLAVSLLVVAMIVGAGLVLWSTGIVVPRLSTVEAGGFEAEILKDPRSFTYQVNLHNDGQADVVVQAVGAEVPGLELVETKIVEGPPPITLHSGEVIGVRLRYRVTDCAAVPGGDWPIPVRVKGYFGVRTVDVMPPTVSILSESPGMTSWSGDRDPYGRSWQDALASMACAPPPIVR